jgi:hypothetical protein
MLWKILIAVICFLDTLILIINSFGMAGNLTGSLSRLWGFIEMPKMVIGLIFHMLILAGGVFCVTLLF